ncbi:MAG: SDR family oxidoreductase [Elusimicrobia bacterium]|nr:SDR family oxidoreductase [Elusimicrobiota bacterium]
MAEPKLLITGASGFIGSRLLRELSGPWQSLGTRLELCAPEKVERALLALAPAAVVHTAALADPDECQRQPELAARVNTDGAHAVARACRRLKARLVHFSTDLVFDGQGSWYKETDRPRPISVYGRTKLAAEDAVLAECPDAAVLRVASVYGRALGGRPSFLDTVRDRLSRGQTLKCFTDQWRTPTPCAQLPEVVAALLGRPELGGLFHWAGATRASRQEFCAAVCRAFGFPESLLEPCRLAEARFAAPRPRDVSLDSGRLSGLIAIPPWTLAEGLSRARRDW